MHPPRPMTPLFSLLLLLFLFLPSESHLMLLVRWLLLGCTKLSVACLRHTSFLLNTPFRFSLIKLMALSALFFSFLANSLARRALIIPVVSICKNSLKRTSTAACPCFLIPSFVCIWLIMKWVTCSYRSTTWSRSCCGSLAILCTLCWKNCRWISGVASWLQRL